MKFRKRKPELAPDYVICGALLYEHNGRRSTCGMEHLRTEPCPALHLHAKTEPEDLSDMARTGPFWEANRLRVEFDQSPVLQSLPVKDGLKMCGAPLASPGAWAFCPEPRADGAVCAKAENHEPYPGQVRQLRPLRPAPSPEDAADAESLQELVNRELRAGFEARVIAAEHQLLWGCLGGANCTIKHVAAQPEGILHTLTGVAGGSTVRVVEDPSVPPGTFYMGTEVRQTSPSGAAKGAKDARYDQIPTEALRQLAILFGRGNQKYEMVDGLDNWRRGYDWSLSYAAAQRHLNLFWGGEDFDPETGVPHVINAAWHCFVLATWMGSPELAERFDDRQDPRDPTEEPLVDRNEVRLSLEDLSPLQHAVREAEQAGMFAKKTKKRKKAKLPEQRRPERVCPTCTLPHAIPE